MAGRRPVGVDEATVAVFTTPLKGAVRAGDVLNEKPHCTASAPSELAVFPGIMRVSAEAPAAAA